MDCMQIDVLIDIFSFGLVDWGGTGVLGVGWIIWGPRWASQGIRTVGTVQEICIGANAIYMYLFV